MVGDPDRQQITRASGGQRGGRHFIRVARRSIAGEARRRRHPLRARGHTARRDGARHMCRVVREVRHLLDGHAPGQAFMGVADAKARRRRLRRLSDPHIDAGARQVVWRDLNVIDIR